MRKTRVHCSLVRFGGCGLQSHLQRIHLPVYMFFVNQEIKCSLLYPSSMFIYGSARQNFLIKLLSSLIHQSCSCHYFTLYCNCTKTNSLGKWKLFNGLSIAPAYGPNGMACYMYMYLYLSSIHS